jgi:hypothetical protein
MLAQLFQNAFLRGDGIGEVRIYGKVFSIHALPKNADEKWLDYWLRLINELHTESPEFTIPYSSTRDAFFTTYVSWAIPSRGAIEFIQHYVGDSILFEVGCGTGIWSLLLKELGVRVEATDLQKDSSFVQVRYDHSIQYGVITQIPETAVLFICWPTYASEWATEMLTMFRGNRIIYIGEIYGCNASDSFFELLEKEWDLLASCDSHVHWNDIYDILYVYDRKEK